MMRKFSNLDGLRGIAAFMVILSHYALAFFPGLHLVAEATHRFPLQDKISHSPLNIVYSGNFAVTTFFVLSGFVLSVRFFGTKDGAVVISTAVKRYIRLMIPALVSVVITFIVIKLGLMHNISVAEKSGSTNWLGTFWVVPANIFIALYEGVYGSFISNAYSYNSSLWTMRYELFGSFIVFMFILLFGKLEKRWLFYIAFSLVFIKTYYLGFILGVALCDIWHNNQALKAYLEKISWVLIVPAVVLGGWSPAQMYIGARLPLFNPEEMLILAHIAGSVCLIMFVLGVKRISKLLETKVFQFLGKISFSLYLIHLMFLGSLACGLFLRMENLLGYRVAAVVSTVISIPLTVLIAAFYSRCVDNKSIELSQRFGDYVLNKKQNT